MMTPKRELKSPNAILSVGSTPRRAKSMDSNYSRDRSFTLPSTHGTISPGTPEILEERQAMCMCACTCVWYMHKLYYMLYS